MERRRFRIFWLYVLAAVLSLAAALIPLLRDRPPNLLFVVLALMWFGLGFVFDAQQKKNEKRPGA